MSVVSGALTAGVIPALAAPAPDARSASSWLPPTPGAWNLVVDRHATAPITLTRGVTENSETLDTVGGRQHTQVMTVDLTDPNVRLGVVEAGGVLTNPADETVGSMAARTGAVAGINGDFFEIHASGRPLGGVITDGELLKSPRPHYNAQLGVRADGSMVIGPQDYAGTLTDGAATTQLASVNVINDVLTGGITRVTPGLGAIPQTGTPGTLVTGHRDGADLVVDAVTPTVNAVPRLAAGTEGLLGGGAGAQWLATTVHPGDRVTIGEHISPDNDLRQLISGSTMLVKDGAADPDPTGTPPSGVNPETAVGLTKDGRHAIIVTLDGRAGEPTAVGVSPDQVAGYLIQHGAYNALLLDGGGSTEMVGRKPGDTADSVLNTPSDGVERPVANGLFVYTTAAAPGAARSVVVNGGAPVVTVPGATVAVPAWATDGNGNPAAAQPSVRVVPPGLADWSNGRLTVHRTGVGQLIASDGRAVGRAEIRVVNRLGSLTVGPDRPDLANGATQAFGLTGTTATGEPGGWLGRDNRPAPVTIPSAAATWSVDPAGLGTIGPDGVFTAADSGSGLVTVTAKAGGRTASTTVAVGSRTALVSDLTDIPNWKLRNTTGQPATLDMAPGDVPPGVTAPGSLRITYTMPAGAGVKQLVFWDTKDITIGADPDGAVPTGIGLWVNGDGNGLILHEQYVQINGQPAPLAETKVTWHGWHFYTAPVPPGTQFPITMDFFDFLAISPSTTVSGSLEVGGLTALFSPRPVVAPKYVPIPKNPDWLRYTEDAGRFTPDGGTMLTGDDAHFLADDPGSTSVNVMHGIADRLPRLPAVAAPGAAQFLGDMSDVGQPADLAFAKSRMASLGLPFRDAVGNHEISQGALPENGNYTAAFGDTHYAYDFGGARWLVTDSAHGGLLSSDRFGVPAEAQYPWLVAQLSATTTRPVVVVTHMPPYDPHPAADSQFTDRWEARMFVRLIQRYAETHPDHHVVILTGHARGVADEVLDPTGVPVDPDQGGVVQLTLADLGMPAYAPADKGGFYHFGLLHVTGRGDIQFSVEPVLASVAVTALATTLPVGATERLAATGTQVSGDNLPVLTIPIADPASHTWSSSDRRVLSVEPNTGQVVARHPGSATVTVSSGGVTASIVVTVTN